MNRIKNLRMYADLSQAAFARLFNVDQTAVSNWEKGKNNVDIRVAEKIAEHFKFPLEFIYGKEFEIANPIENWHPSEIEDYQREIPEIREILLFKKGRGYFSTQTSESEKKPTPKDELLEDVIIYHRDGQTVKREFTKEQMDMLVKMIEALPEKPKDI